MGTIEESHPSPFPHCLYCLLSRASDFLAIAGDKKFLWSLCPELST
jgi:hypothetical protein